MIPLTPDFSMCFTHFSCQHTAEVWDFPHLKFSGNTFHGWGLPRSDGSQHRNLEMFQWNDLFFKLSIGSVIFWKFHRKFGEYCGENEMRSKLRKESFQEEGVDNFGERRCVWPRRFANHFPFDPRFIWMSRGMELWRMCWWLTLVWSTRTCSEEKMGSKNPTVRQKMPLETVKCYGVVSTFLVQVRLQLKSTSQALIEEARLYL